ncbi:hypothetical protein ACLMJK_005192 [Lecanora helva]
MVSLRSRYIFLPLILALVTITLFLLRSSLPYTSQPPPPPEKPPLKPHPLYKPPKPEKPPPLPEYFPLAASAKSPADLPPVPSWNKPPSPHVPEKTRLYIGFTRYWPLLQQVVISYITAGWPPSDIYVVENTGTFDANKKGQLTSQNPFYMDYHRLTEIFGVNVMTTPSLQSFAQLQNLYLSEAINNNLTHYFWGHMDVVAQSHEDAVPYRSLYQIAVDTIRESFAPDYLVDKETGKKAEWAVRFFSYDWLALVNVAAYVKVGGWDTMIGYYGTDCDMHSRFGMNDLKMPIADAGQVFDVGDSMPDLERLYRRKKKVPKSKREEKITGSTFDDEKKLLNVEDSGKISVIGNVTGTIPSLDTKSTAPSPSGPVSEANKKYLEETEEDTLGSEGWKKLQVDLEAMAQAKRDDPYRNSWQLKQKGGQGEPFYYDADGWEKALQMTIETGTKIYDEKWGHRGCNIRDVGLKEGDQWRVEHDW